MSSRPKRRRLLWATVLLGSTVGAACQNPPAAVVNSNANGNLSNANTAAGTTTTAATPVPTALSGTAVAAREPERYVASLLLTAQTGGAERTSAFPPLTAEVSRNGADRRLAFKLPNGDQYIFLDKPSARYVIAPNRKQYAELTPEATGFDLPRMMTPGQIIAQLQNLRGYQLAGEEQVDGRTALKYTYSGASQTGTQAGEVKAEGFVYVDKETGLPLRSELTSQAQGSVQGVNNLKIVAEMRDIKTEIDPATFEVPTEGYSKVEAAQVRQQLDAVMAVAQAVLRNVILQNNTTATPAAPAATVTPATR